MKDDVPFRLDGKVAAVVGAASGIGEAVAVAVRAARRARRLPGRGRAARPAQVAAAIQSSGGAGRGGGRGHPRRGGGAGGVRRRSGSGTAALDVAVCTPSVNVRKPLLAYTEEEFDRVVSLNLRGNFNVLRAAGRIMTAQGRGSIVLFSSIRSLTVEPGQGVYAATKAGIVQLVRTAAAEFGPQRGAGQRRGSRVSWTRR